MNVLSLFDGMSCGRIALEKVGIKPDNYFASEVDKYAISVAKHNYPDIKHIGDVTQVKAFDLPPIDLLIGGSPCQGFSFAGKQLNFEDPRSKLFFEYVRLLKEIQSYNPHVLFLLENVKMKKEYQDVISDYMGVQPIEINSRILSAQSRGRLYWTNIPFSKICSDKNLVIRDILDKNAGDDFDINSEAVPKYLDDWGKPKGYSEITGKAKCLTASMHKGYGNDGCTVLDKYEIFQYFENPKISENGLIQVGILGSKYEQGNRIYSVEGKYPTLMHGSPIGGAVPPKIALNINRWRKLTPLECERLQTVPDNYTATVSNSQRYKMLGNGWTVDMIAHIFKNLDLLC